MSPILAAALVVFFEGIAVASVFPVIHAYTADFGGGKLWVGVMFALVAGPKIILNPLWGGATDRFGRRRVLLIITLGTFLGSVGWVLAGSLLWLAGARLIVGLFSAQAVVASAIIGDAAPRGKRAAGMAALGAGFGMAITLGPALGGIVGTAISLRAVGWLCATSQLLSMAVITFGLRETRFGPAAPPRPGATRELLSNVRIIRLLAATLATTMGFALLTSVAGLHTEAFYGFTTRHAGYALAYLGFVSVLVQGGVVRPLSRRCRESSITAAGLVFTAAGFGLMSVDTRLYPFFAAVALIAIGSALTIPCLSSMLSHAVGADEQGAIQGLNQSATALGRTIGYFAGPVVWETAGVRACFGMAAAIMIIGLVALPLTAEASAAVPVVDEPA